MDLKYEPSTSDVDFVKSTLGPKWDEADLLIRSLLPAAYELAVSATNNDFGGVRGDGSIEVPATVRLFMAKYIELISKDTSLKSRSMGSVSYSYQSEVPSALMSLLRPYKRMRFHAAR